MVVMMYMQHAVREISMLVTERVRMYANGRVGGWAGGGG